MLGEIGIPVYAVFGNVDGAHFEITNWVKESAPQFKLFKTLGKITLDKRKIAFCHYPELAKGIAHTKEYDAVFCGHSHEAVTEKIGETLLSNPGEVAGMLGRCSFGIYDTENNEMEIREVT